MVTREEATQAAGEVYGAILADPERREQLRRARIAKAGIEHEDGHWTWPKETGHAD